MMNSEGPVPIDPRGTLRHDTAISLFRIMSLILDPTQMSLDLNCIPSPYHPKLS
jgi:hypothetical protein